MKSRQQLSGIQGRRSNRRTKTARLNTRSRSSTARSSKGKRTATTARSRRSQSKTTARAGSARTSRSAKTTTDHDEIREWVESHGGHPATVKRTRKSDQAAGLIRIDFPGYSGAQSLKEISWNEWFDMFEKRKLAFLYQDKGDSRFNKLVSRKN